MGKIQQCQQGKHDWLVVSVCDVSDGLSRVTLPSPKDCLDEHELPLKP